MCIRDRSDAIIDENGQSILYTAGTDINLEAPFEVILGTTFEARIEPCTPLTIQQVEGSENKAITTDAITELFSNLETQQGLFKVSILDGNENVVNSLNSSITDKDIGKVMSIIQSLSKGSYNLVIEAGDNITTEKIFIIK